MDIYCLSSPVRLRCEGTDVAYAARALWIQLFILVFAVFQKSFRKRRTVGTTDLWSDNESSSQNMHLHIDYPDDFSRLWASGREEADSTRRQSQEKYWSLLQSSIYPLLFDRI